MRNDILQKLERLGLKPAYITGGEAYLSCPFHSDGRPSFCVSLSKPCFYCHSCEIGGSLSYLAKLLEGKSIHTQKTQQMEPESEIRGLANISVEDFDSLPPALGCKYLDNREIFERTVKEWDIRRSLLFIVVPAKNRDGKIVGLILRAILSSWFPRYQYTVSFHKSGHLFGIDRFCENDLVILTEGIFDTIKLHQYGFTNTLAILGSSISSKQIEILRMLGDNVLLFMDRDARGILATKETARKLSGFNVLVPRYSAYTSDDPAECGKEEINEIINTAVPYLKAKLNGGV